MQEAGVSGFDLWRTNSPLVTFSALTPAVTFDRDFLSEALTMLAEGGKGMPPGWVSAWGDKKVQKQTDGNWAYVPHDTPLGMQPYHKGSGETVKLSPDEEMHGYLKSINFHDPATQKTLTNSPKFVGDMLKKFGAGWYDKYKKLAAKTPDEAPPPTVAPTAPTGTPVELTLKKLNISPTSKEASAVELLHKTGSLDAAVNAYSKKHGLKYAIAFYEVEDVVKKGTNKGAFSTTGDWETDLKITFNLGTGPVISAPPVGATTSAPSLGIKPELPKPVKAKKPKASTSTPVPPAEPIPSLPSVDTPTNPQVLALAAKMGYATNADVAKVLGIWRKHLKKNHTTALDKTVSELTGLLPVSTPMAGLKNFVNGLVKKAYATPDWDAASFLVDPEPAKPSPIAVGTPIPGLPGAPKPPEPAPVAPTPPPEIPSLAIDKAVSDMVGKLGYKMGSAGAVAVGMIMAHDGDLAAAGKGLAASLGMGEGPASKVVKFVQAKINALKSGTDQPEAPLAVAQIIGDTPIHAGRPKKKKEEPTVLPSIPSMATLSFAGDAKTKLGGNKPKKFLKDDAGNLFLHKYGADQLRAAGGEVASVIASMLGGPGTFVPVKAVEYEGDWGTVQPVVPNLEKGGLPEDPTKLTKDEIKQLQRERLIDWAVSNHDSKLGNFIKTTGGQIFGIDKEQAFKFIGSDKLSLDYSPNPSPPIYNALYQAYADKKIDLDPNDMLPFIEAAEKLTESQWMEAVKPYIAAIPQGPEMDAKLNAIVNRKNNLRKDFEAFFTMLRKKRGEGAFTFAGPAPVAQTGVPAPAPAQVPAPKAVAGTGMLAAPAVPDIASLTYEGPATGIGGAGEKHFYKDSSGKKWLLKVAANKTTKKSEPWKVAAQSLFSMVGAAVKPTTPPVGATTFKGKPATLQSWLGDNLKTLSGTPPQKLSASEKQDVATEHVLDWLMSQHDTHGGNLVVLPDSGAVVGIDKEQGFKYLMPSLKWTASTPQGDKLSTDYHPNAQYGESQPYYNTFWKGFENGDFNFDPTVMKGAIEAVEKIDDATYTAGLVSYAQAVWPEDAAQAAQFYEKAFARKQNIRKEFEAFITDLYKKRTKKEGLFTFNAGWVPQGAEAPPVTAPAVPAPPPAPPKTPTAPVQGPVPKPDGYVPPPGFAGAAAKLGFSPGSVYYPALKQLHLYNNDVKKAADQLSYMKGIAPEMALKRVKYALKKLKGVGGWAAFNPDAQTAPAVPGVPAGSSGGGAATYTPVTALNPPGGSPGGLPMTSFIPGASDELGNKNLKMVSPSEAYKPPPPPPLPPVPPGFEPPPAGKMWEVSPASAFFSSGGAGGKLYKTKPPKKPDGTPDTESSNLVAKFQGTTIAAVEQALQQVEVKPVVPLKEKSPYVIGVFAKDDWQKAQTSPKKLGVLVDLPPPPPPPSGKFTAIPQAGELKNAPASAGMKELAKVQDSLLGFGAGFRIDGPAVEHHSMSVQRRLNTIGKPYYRFMFKLREPVWTKLKGYDSAQGSFVRATYNQKEDAFKDTNNTEYSYSARQWKAGNSTAFLGTGDDAYALKGQVTCNVYPEEGQTPLEALKKLLKTMGPDLADQVLQDPTPEDEKLLKLSALFWSAAPSEADALPESKRNVAHLTDRLKTLGFSEEQMDSVRFERVGVDQTVPVLPGRGKALQDKHKISHISVAVSSPEKVMLQVRGGTVGCVQRLKHGFSLSGATSASSDIESGGGDYVFTMPGKKGQSGWGNHWGQIEMVYDPSEMDRLDSFMYDFDGYGRTKGEQFHKRKTLEQSAGSASEIVFRQGLNMNKLLKIRCQDPASVQKIIKLMKDSGITKINGMTPEELVVSGNDFYNSFLKPAGY